MSGDYVSDQWERVAPSATPVLWVGQTRTTALYPVEPCVRSISLVNLISVYL